MCHFGSGTFTILLVRGLFQVVMTHCVEMLPASRCCRILSGLPGLEAQPSGCHGSTHAARYSFQILVSDTTKGPTPGRGAHATHEYT